MKKTIPAAILLSLLFSYAPMSQADSSAIDQAVRYYDAAVKKAPATFQPYLDRANYYKSIGKLDKALADMNKAVQFGGYDPHIILSRAFLYEQMKDYPHAMLDIEKAIKTDESLIDGFAARAELYTKMKQYDKSIAEVNKQLKTHPRAGFLYCIRGYNFQEMKQPEKALKDFSAAIACDPRDLRSLTYRYTYYKQHKQNDKALQDLSEIIQNVPENYIGKASLYKERIGLYDILGETSPDVLGVDLYKLSELEPKNIESRYRFAALCWRKEPTVALKELDQAMTLAPKDAKFFALRGRVNAELTHLDKAMVDCNKAIEMDANGPDGYAARALANLGLFKYEDSVRDAEKASSIAPGMAEPYYVQGMALEKLNSNQKALAAFNQFVALKSKESKLTDEDQRHVQQAKRKVEILGASLTKEQREAAAATVHEVAPTATKESAPAATKVTAPTATKESAPAATKVTAPAATKEAAPTASAEKQPVSTSKTPAAVTPEKKSDAAQAGGK